MTSLKAIVRKAIDAVLKKDSKTKKKAGEDLTADCFAYVGDKEDPSTWKLPIKFSTEEKTKSHIRNALARFSQTQGIPEDKKASVRAKIEAAAKKHGIEVSEEKVQKVKAFVAATLEKGAAAKGLAKDFFAVKQFADVMTDLVWLWHDQQYEASYEGDDSGVPEEIRDHVEALAETFLAMVHEEVSELTATAEGKVKGAMLMSTTNNALNKAHSAVQHLGKMKDALAAHHEKCMKMHKDHCAKMEEVHKAHHGEMQEMCSKMHKILGTEEAESLAGGDHVAEPNDLSYAAPEVYGKKAADGSVLLKAGEFEAAMAKTAETAVEKFIVGLTKAVNEAAEEDDGEDDGEDGKDGKKKAAKKAAASVTALR